jgi:hypothetical protein
VFSIYLWVSERFGKSKDQPETAVVVTLNA